MGPFIVQFLTGLSNASALFLVAAGLSLIFGVSRVVNMAHGSFYMVGAYVAYFAISWLPKGGFWFWGGILIAAVVVGLLGTVVEVLLLRRIYRAPELFMLMATFAVLLVIQDLALWVFGAEDLLGPRAPGLDGSIQILGALMPEYDIALILIAPLVLVGLWFLLNRTRWGVLVRAATEDREMLAALGVNQKRLFTGVFFLGSFLAGLGGAVQLPKGGADLLMDLNVIAAAFVVVVVGGMGSIPGAFLAALILGELTSFGVLFIPQSTLVMMFFVMAVVLVIRPYGLLGKPEGVEHTVSELAQWPLRKASRKLRVTGAVLAAVLLAFPLFAGSFQLILIGEIAMFALACMSLFFITGPGGMVSFGHAAFFGGGAYAAALFVHHVNTPMELALLLAPTCMALLALVIGWFCVRLSGVYLAMLTLAFAQICWAVVCQWGRFTGGDDGVLGIWPSPWAGNEVIFYYLAIIISGGGILALRYLLFTPFGYAMRACRDSRLRAAAIGIHVRRRQWYSFAVAGMFAGLAGGIYVFSKGSVFPYEMSIPRSFDILLSVLLGGIHSLSGPVVGSAAFIGLEDLISRVHFWRLILGSIFILLVVCFPQGIAGYFSARFAKEPGDQEAGSERSG
ncbi:MAG: ABC transporter permease [Deltaproteobacteria bacterium]|nr:ABC transporter permease [Deltaproteobacteria bacterium]MBW1921922.1 ABC transporter permease [Deltaproteobacteria bacterium]MBW1948810.1 ABC transporter permease [Deltaproteobacteria bacterium]MBW2006487.1 ABC transporter permease [Deltaproteobacteria bacterium]MBW2101183.1 ABC transporter permease [Deltaproteobacteria bacterium]